MVWLLILFPGVAVIGGFFTLYLAIISDDGLVKDDYYQKGKQINRVLARDKMASQLGLTAKLQIDQEAGRVGLFLGSPLAVELPNTVSLGIFHRTRPGYDQIISLIKVQNNEYQGQINDTIHGRYNLELGTRSWRLTGLLQYPPLNTIHLKPLSTVQ